ncbi:MAG: carbohydrate kinase family protein [Candidatus Kerfeldbacteria bacterium]|nr:carbohydrate kinase family protein [Candidatus Kerfeldbacteria bacterium]
MNIIIHGSLAFDRIMNFPGKFKENILPNKIHNLNVSFNIHQMEEMRGGTGGNIVYTLALLGEHPVLVSCIGKDGSPYIEFLRNHGVNTEHITTVENEVTAVCNIITDTDNNQITAFFVGAAAQPSKCDFSQWQPEETLVVFAPANNKTDSMHYIADCQRLGLRYIFDPGQTTYDYNGKELKEIIGGAWMLAVNDYELEVVLKKTGLSEQNLLERTEVLLVTLGKKGSVMKTRDGKIFDIPAFVQDKLVDPTGAGDAYRAGLIKGLALGKSLEECGKMGACAASYAIEKVGTQQHTFTLAEFDARYKAFFA